METTTIIYQNEEYEAYPLAEFKMADEAVCQRRSLFGRIKSATKEKERALALVFIPHRDRLGELAIIPRESSKRPTIAEYFTALSKDEKIGEKIAFCDFFVSSFTLEAPYTPPLFQRCVTEQARGRLSCFSKSFRGYCRRAAKRIKSSEKPILFIISVKTQLYLQGLKGTRKKYERKKFSF